MSNGKSLADWLWHLERIQTNVGSSISLTVSDEKKLQSVIVALRESISRQRIIDELLKEYTYWRDVGDDYGNEETANISIGAMGSVANVLARIMLIDPVAPHQEPKDTSL